jgi:hypothetical protein
MTTITLEGRSFTCSLRFSHRRRSLQIRVSRPDFLELAAPTGMSWSQIQQLVETKRVWVLRQVRRLEAVAANPANASLTHGATLLYRGQPHTLLLLADAAGRPNVTYSACNIAVHLPELVGEDNDPAVWQSLKQWYLEQSHQQLLERTRYWSAQIGVRPARISLRDQKTRWGSCSSRGTVSFNWRIIMAPPAVLDYLVVHELCHMLHPNHSPAYWREVARWIPDCREQRRWLKQNGDLLGKILAG